MAERSLRAVPWSVLALLALALASQLAWNRHLPPRATSAQALPPAPTHATVIAVSLGENILASQWLALYLQAFDNPPGVSIPFRDLDYPRVVDWLELMQELDPRAQYPLLMATRLYAQVPDPARQRLMLDFAYREFLAAPNQRWPWLAHAAIVAKHRLHDLPLALKYAQAIAQHATAPEVPHWAQQMPIFILADMGETESAKVLLGALLANHKLTDPREIHFLTGQLDALEARSVEKSSPRSNFRQDTNQVP